MFHESDSLSQLIFTCPMIFLGRYHSSFRWHNHSIVHDRVSGHNQHDRLGAFKNKW